MRLLSHTHTHTHTELANVRSVASTHSELANVRSVASEKNAPPSRCCYHRRLSPLPPHINVAWLLARSRCEKNAPFRQGSDGQALPTLKWGGEGGGRSRASVCKGALFSLGTGRECRVCARSSSPDLCFSVLACVGAAAQS